MLTAAQCQLIHLHDDLVQTCSATRQLNITASGRTLGLDVPDLPGGFHHYRDIVQQIALHLELIHLHVEFHGQTHPAFTTQMRFPLAHRKPFNFAANQHHFLTGHHWRRATDSDNTFLQTGALLPGRYIQQAFQYLAILDTQRFHRFYCIIYIDRQVTCRILVFTKGSRQVYLCANKSRGHNDTNISLFATLRHAAQQYQHLPFTAARDCGTQCIILAHIPVEHSKRTIQPDVCNPLFHPDPRCSRVTKQFCMQILPLDATGIKVQTTANILQRKLGVINAQAIILQGNFAADLNRRPGLCQR